MPFIPKEHEKYNLLPRKTENGGECFVYPERFVDSIADKLSELCEVSLIPYGYNCYQDYYDYIDELDQQYSRMVPNLHKNFDRLKDYIGKNNDKSVWSICRYKGPEGLELTKGQCYYWPTSLDNPVYKGVIDDEEFSNYVYDTNPDNWEVIEDPTGMARKTLEKGSIRNLAPTTEDLYYLCDNTSPDI